MRRSWRERSAAFSRDGIGSVEQPETLYKPYLVGRPGSDVACGFRDHTLSDLIGFTYAGWPAESAAGDFVQRLVAGGNRYRDRTGGKEATVFVILDGENAWEHYEGQGRPFLRALYRRLESHSEIRTVTMSEACADARSSLPAIAPGSWINGDFYIWIGHPDDHRAWSQLAEARRALGSMPPGLSETAVARAHEELLIAEGSDWFWWYGDDHSSAHDAEFDELFRRHVRNVYRALDKPIPEELFVTNITTQPPLVEVLRPTGFIHPIVDGDVTSYFEWLGAGCVDATSTSGAMHQVSGQRPAISLIEFGFDLENLYVRVDSHQSMLGHLERGVELTLNFLEPAGTRIKVRHRDQAIDVTMFRRRAAEDWRPVECPALRAAARMVLEIQVPFRCLGLTTHSLMGFFVSLDLDGVEIDRHPLHRPIEIEVPDPQFAAANWTV